MALRLVEIVPIPVAVQAGASVGVDEYSRLAVYVSGTFVATIQIQTSPDGSEWFDEGSALTAPGVVEITKPCLFIRANVTAFTGGAPVGKVVGQYGAGG